MANNQSWEFYQQSDTGTKYPLKWIAGLTTATPLGTPSITLTKDILYLVPFDQMRAVTVSKMAILLRVAGKAGAKLRIGIYANNSSTDNYPKGRVLDAGEIDVSGAGGVKEITGLNANLSADTRYWAAVLTNDSTVQIGALPASSIIFWAAVTTPAILAPQALSWHRPTAPSPTLPRSPALSPIWPPLSR
jgi:hypothetical protein